MNNVWKYSVSFFNFACLQESVIEIEYVESHPPPEPEDSLLHDDWVSAVHAMNDL
jgi:hypothetical protein